MRPGEKANPGVSASLPHNERGVEGRPGCKHLSPSERVSSVHSGLLRLQRSAVQISQLVGRRLLRPICVHRSTWKKGR